ncbi:MAG: hypothetical protein GY765_35875, partial [bacterium]|nr:hypothetical protein [bacterium]
KKPTTKSSIDIDIDSIKKSTGKTTAKSKSPKEKSSAISLLDSLGDESRLTLLKKIKRPKKGSPIIIEIKDNDSLLLEPLEIKVSPGVKKITLILDVKK